MIKNKKGAIELSVNTIVVIVIGVTLLTLGLVFVRQILRQGTDLSDKAFEEANKQLDSLGGEINEFITVAPETRRVKAGDTSGVIILIKNIVDKSFSGVVATITTSSDAAAKNVKCEFSDGMATKNLRTPLGPGAEDRFRIRIKTTKASIGSYGCEFELSGGGVELETFSTRRDIEVIVSS